VDYQRSFNNGGKENKMRITKRIKEAILWARQWAEFVSKREVLSMWENNMSMKCDYNEKGFNYDIKEKSKLEAKKTK